MASIVKRKRKDGTPSYHVKYTVGDGEQRWEQFDRQKDAQARKIEVENERRLNRRWEPPVAKTLGSYADEWLAEYARHNVRRRVYTNYEGAVRLYIKPELGGLELGAVTARSVKTLVGKMRADGKADNTIRNVIVPLREMLSHAVEDKLIAANPIAGLRLLGNRGERKAKRKIVPPTDAEVEKLITHRHAETGELSMRVDAREALIVATATGLRRGELFGLRWGDVDWDKRTIHVHATNHGGQVEETTKTEAGERHVPLFESARKILAARKLRTSEYDRPEDFVFATSVGTPVDPNNFVKREFRPALERASLGEWRVDENGRRRWTARFRWHDLRHYAVSSLIAAGADIKLLQAISGHASATMTLDVYGHLMTERVTEAATQYDPLPATAVYSASTGTGGNHAVRSGS